MLNHVYADVREFESHASPEERDEVQKAIEALSGDAKRDFYEKYIAMCHKVARISAETFNENYMSAKQKKKSQADEHLAKVFFRLNSVPYLMVGIDGNREFALVMPSITEWRRNWVIKDVSAVADIHRRQCVVNFRLVCKEKEPKKEKSSKGEAAFNFHAEVRWSHGKFCGNPEAKLYKEFRWADLPFFKRLPL